MARCCASAAAGPSDERHVEERCSDQSHTRVATGSAGGRRARHTRQAGACRSAGKVIRAGESLASSELDRLTSLAVSDEAMQRYPPPSRGTCRSSTAVRVRPAGAVCVAISQTSLTGRFDPTHHAPHFEAREDTCSDRLIGRI